MTRFNPPSSARDARATRTASTSPRLRGEVGSRSDPGEGAFPRAEHFERAPHPDPLPASGEREQPLGDLRFCSLLTDQQWAALPPAIRRRFSKRLAGGDSVVYAGEIVETTMSRAGWLLAQALRVIGAPLPVARIAHVASVVTVTEDMRTGGQIWTRLYGRRDGFPQVVHSSKRFAGKTGLEEYVGFGIGMSLTLAVEDGELSFRSAGYFLQLGKRRVFLPAWATPGNLCVKHAELENGYFRFSLELVHPRFGALIRQVGVFREAKSCPD